MTAAGHVLPGRITLLRQPMHLVVIGSIVLAVAVALSYGAYEPSEVHDAIALASGLAALALIAYARYGLGLPWLSASLVYLLLFWMFHFGLVFTAALDPGVLASLQDWELEWLYWPNVRLAMLLGVLGAAGFVAGLAATASGGTPVPAAVPPPAYDPSLYGVGWILMLGGIGGAVFTLLAGGGLGVLGLSYAEFRNGVLGVGHFQTFLDLSQLGCVLALCGADRRRWARPLAVWSPLAGLMLLVGLRTEAMVPAVAFVIVLAHRGIRFRRRVLLTAVVVSMIVIPAIRTIRNVGFSNRAEVDWTSVSPLETFTELGGTLRAVKAYIDWIEQGDEHLLGATYWAPFDRQILVRLVPGREPIPYEEDERLPERHIEREGAVGLAATGEAYYNFGPAGPFIYFTFLGALFGWLERRAWSTPYHCAALGIVMGIFYFNIRSHWLFVPAQTAIALVPLAFCYLLRRAAGMHRARALPAPWPLGPTRFVVR